MGAFFLNLYFYKTISVNPDTSPYEILGVGLYHLIILCLLIALIYSICRLLFNEELFALFATITSISCSSYLFWATTLKDHIDTVFFLTLIIFLILKYRQTGDPWYYPAAFIVSGLIIWIRPEFGVFIAIATLILLITPIISAIRRGEEDYKKLILFFSPFFTVIGTIPLFIGNYLTTGNPLLLAWQVKTGPGGINLTTNTSSLPESTTVITVAETIIHRLTPGTESLGSDIYGFLISPMTLKVPLLSLTPLFTLGLLLLPFIYLYLKRRIEKDEWITISTLIIFVIATFMAYSTSITGLGMSIGVYPDVRYLSPAYLPLNLIGLLIIRKIIPDSVVIKRILLRFCFFVIIGIPVVIGLMTYFHSSLDFWEMFLYLNGITPVIIYLSIGISFILITIGILNSGRVNIPVTFIAISLAIPLIWQVALMTISNYYIDVFTTYPPLLPGVRALFEYLFTL